MRKRRHRNGTGQRWLEDHISHHGDDCLIWPFSCATPGYGQFMPTGHTKVVMAHRYMCEAAHGPAPSDTHQAAHACGNRRCVNPDHLSWKTGSANQLDRRIHGTQPVPGRAKINFERAEQIRKLKGIETSIETAARYGITESNVRLIQDGKIWNTTGRKHSMLLPYELVRSVRNSDNTRSHHDVGKEFGINPSTVWRIRTWRAYRHVQ